MSHATATPSLRYVHCPGASKNSPNGMGHAQTHRMAYWDWTGAHTQDKGHVIVCVHGLSRNGRDFDVLAQSLSARARVVCPDVVGRGQSDWLADPQGYQIPVYVGDMLALMGQLMKDADAAGQPITRLDWIGTSMGGLIGLGFVTLPGLPIPISRLVLNDVGPTIESDAVQRIGQYVGQAIDFADEAQAAAYLRQIATGFGPHTDAQWLALSRPQLRRLDSGRLALHYDPAIAQPFKNAPPDAAAVEQTLWSLYDAVTAQTLLLRGRDSDLLSHATAQAMTQRGPRAQLVEFDGVGHAPTLVQPEQTRIVMDFLFESGVHRFG